MFRCRSIRLPFRDTVEKKVELQNDHGNAQSLRIFECQGLTELGTTLVGSEERSLELPTSSFYLSASYVPCTLTSDL